MNRLLSRNRKTLVILLEKATKRNDRVAMANLTNRILRIDDAQFMEENI